MAQDVQNLRDILALARMLRGFARGHTHDRGYVRLLAAAAELEARARFLATSPETAPAALERESALHAPVDLVI